MPAHRSTPGSLAIASALIVFPLLLVSSNTRANEFDDDIAVPDSSEHRYQAAREAAQTGEFDRAISEYAALMLEEPENVDYIFGYAQALYWSDEIAQSLHHLKLARVLAPDYEDIWKLEYRARIALTRDPSSVSVEQYRQMAAERFPNAEWHRKAEKTTSKKYHWELSADRERLDNGAPDWRQLSAFFGLDVTEKALLTLTANSMTRFSTTDTQLGFGGSIKTSENWTFGGSLAVSSSPSFLPETAIDLRVSRRFEHGWVGGARWRRRDYEDTSVDSFGLITERYFGKYRIAYALDSARLASQQAVVHAFTVNFYADAGSQFGVILAAGEEIEIVGPGQLLRTDVDSFALTGRHPINEHLGFGWRLATHRQGQLYRRSAIGISVSGGF